MLDVLGSGLTLRITTLGWKVAYIGVGWLAFIAARLAFEFLGVDAIPVVDQAFVIHFALLRFLWVYYGTRIFRGADERVEPPRPWWRMTAGHRAGFWLAAYFGGNLIFTAAAAVADPMYVAGWVSALVLLALTALYLVSSARLLWQKV
ncbi:hypothetical protein M2152_002604 [Microbacteriaceae bacterium SG_E_30_P1]|uniref:GtrA-like protein domain-containing protein n=1 Tax=Antiquaquibacter oligotrophicus TaxID=2880260 RepID=A0ABT6KR09_9MICO|nr:hypothetical protein [Antiquaquibacter oligotrophicus]MDH6182422.1 hypothetical protein [Antiquaquibacter oligotrophicus]UDF14607.1 hypothetical protein LH407_07025 [Antiquaquibacter oligotrophicus]